MTERTVHEGSTATKKDLRDSRIYAEVEAIYHSLRRPSSGLISDAAEISAFGGSAVFSGSLVNALQGIPPTRICSVDLASGATRILTQGPNIDRSPKYAPNGARVAFLSDRHRAGDFQLYLLDLQTGAALSAARVDGWVEYIHWSADGRKILLGVAGHGADVAGGQGAVTSQRDSKDSLTWLPLVQDGDESCQWRSAWVYDVATDRVLKVSPAGLNIWEATWCGNGALAVVASPGPGEGLWYSAGLHVIEIDDGTHREIYRPGDQLGWPAACPSGLRLAFVEATCSDRWIVAGNLKVIDVRTGKVKSVDALGVDITYAEWRSEQRLLLAGHRGFETVVGVYDASVHKFSETWSSAEVTTGGFYAAVSGVNDSGDCVLVGEGFDRAPEIGVIRQGVYHSVKSFDLGYAQYSSAISAITQVAWKAPDGLVIEGWLLRPSGRGPHPTILSIHGGPVSHWRPVWLGRRNAHILMLIGRGYAVFLPNPRGSTGRGQEFARHVWGDVGGADTYDFLSGLDYLVENGIADPARLGVTGGSYGGFMTSWLITQDQRFAAAVSVAPVTNQVTAHLISNIPHYVALSLADRYTNCDGKYFQRSPIMHAHNVRTPTLNICGALDRCTPPEEAVQFHNALLENGVRSALVTYPEEGHGVRKWPASMDFAARVVAWFEEFMPPGKSADPG